MEIALTVASSKDERIMTGPLLLLNTAENSLHLLCVSQVTIVRDLNSRFLKVAAQSTGRVGWK
jgi:hypothetical protein